MTLKIKTPMEAKSNNPFPRIFSFFCHPLNSSTHNLYTPISISLYKTKPSIFSLSYILSEILSFNFFTMEALGSKSKVMLLSFLFLLLLATPQLSDARPLRGVQETINTLKPETAKKAKALDGNYAPLLLNLLPRGPVPPSGPSGGINELNN